MSLLRLLRRQPLKHSFSSCLASMTRSYSSSSSDPSSPCLWFPRLNRLEPMGGSTDGRDDLPKVLYSLNDGKGESHFVPDSYHLLRCTDKKIIEVPNNLLRDGQELLRLSRRHCWGSSHGWLVYENPAEETTYLYNPFADPATTTPYLHLGISSFEEKWTDFSIPVPFQQLHWYVYFDEIDVPMSTDNPFVDRRFGASLQSRYPYVDKRFAFSSPPGENSNCTILAIIKDKLYFCKPGEIPWTSLSIANKLQDYIDVAYSPARSRFFALSYRGRLEAIDLSNPSAPEVVLVDDSFRPPDFRKPYPDHSKNYGHCRNNYLVDSAGQLMMVERYTYHFDKRGYNPVQKHEYCQIPTHINFVVFKFDFDKSQWVSVSEIGEKAIFVGINESVCVSVEDYPGLTPNSIYFTSHESDFTEESDGLFDAGVYNLADGKHTPLYFREPKKFNRSYDWLEGTAKEEDGVFYECAPVDIDKDLQPPIWVFPRT